MRKDLENEDIMSYIHYLGLDDNIELFEELKDEIRFVLNYSRKNDLDFCLVDDFENGYFKDFELVKQFDKLCCIKEIESFIDKPIETKIGTFYITRDSREDFGINSKKIYLSNRQKEYIFETLDLIESFKEEILEDAWYIQECDFGENYVDGINIYPYQIVDENTDYMIECITKDFYEDIMKLKN